MKRHSPARTAALLLVMNLMAAVTVLTGCGPAVTDHHGTSAEPGGGDSSPVIIEDGQTIAFLGDSITADGSGYGKYCRLVVHGLKARGIHVTPVLAGVSGNTSRDMLARLEQDVLRHEPDWVILAAGVNDIWHGDPTVKIGVFQPKPGMGVKLDEYKKNVTEIMDRCEQAGANVVLTSITPIREDPEFKLNVTSRTYNAFLDKLARERGLPLAHLNEAMFSEIARGTRLTSDGVHPNTQGHRIMAQGILQAMGLTVAELDAIEQEWEDSPHVLLLGDRQTTSGTRTGGWCQLLMDGMNSGREMVTYKAVADYRKDVTVRFLLDGFKEKAPSGPRYVILQAPIGDVEKKTPAQDYRRDLKALIELAKDADIKPIAVTLPVRQNDLAAPLNAAIAPYNKILREVVRENGVPLADIHAVMVKHYQADPDQRLTFDGERFNHEGAMLMAEVVLQAMGLESVIDKELRTTWKERPSYTKRYRRGKGKK